MLTGLDAQVDAVFGRRLLSHDDRPLAVALSGGGDSLALLLLTAAWARANGRRMIALSVDHGLQPESAAWQAFAHDAARRAGAAWTGLSWTGPKPSSGLAAAARRARHGLIADAAREAGASVVLMGHTADDLAESAWMRREGSSLGDPREWAPSPAWPEGRGLMILRPLLGVGRTELRAWLTARGQTWIDDPANADPAHARVRARRALAEAGWDGSEAPVCGGEAIDADVEALPSGGGLFLPPGSPFIGQALVCASGGERLARADALNRIRQRICADRPFASTLAGARLAFDGTSLLVTREPGRAGLSDLMLPAGRTLIWDGRYAVTAREPGWSVGPALGRRRLMTPNNQAIVNAEPAAARPTRPVLFRAGDPSPILAGEGVTVRPLALERFRLATGGAVHEGDLAPPAMA